MKLKEKILVNKMNLYLFFAALIFLICNVHGSDQERIEEGQQSSFRDKAFFEFDSNLGIVATNNSVILNRFLDKPTGLVRKVFIYSSTNEEEARKIIKIVCKNSNHLGTSLKGIDVLRDSECDLVEGAILPLLRELITSANGFTALDEPWWEESLVEKVWNWFYHPSSEARKNREYNHVKAH